MNDSTTQSDLPTTVASVCCWVGLDWADKKHHLVVRTDPAKAGQEHQVEQKPEKLDELRADRFGDLGDKGHHVVVGSFTGKILIIPVALEASPIAFGDPVRIDVPSTVIHITPPSSVASMPASSIQDSRVAAGATSLRNSSRFVDTSTPV